MKTIKIDNELQITVIPHSQSKTAYMLLSVDSGPVDEYDGEEGCAHLLEHLMFKGTKSRSALDMENVLSNVGGSRNAATSFDDTNYTAVTLGEDVETGLDILHDMMTDIDFTEEDCLIEKDVVAEELAEPDRTSISRAYAAAYRSHPYGRDIGGTVESVMALTNDSVWDYFKRTYRPDSMRLTVCGGGFDPERISDHAIRIFGQIPSKSQTKPKRPAPVYVGGDDRKIVKDDDVGRVSISFAAAPYLSRDYFIDRSIACILGEHMWSRLHQELRERRGLVYHVSAYTHTLGNSGLFTIDLEATENKVDEACCRAVDCVNDMRTSIVNNDLFRAKKAFRFYTASQVESCSATAHYANMCLSLYGKVFDLDDVDAKYDAVEEWEIAARLDVLLKNPSVGVYGNGEKAPDAARISSML